jgi:hypothetical protein
MILTYIHDGESEGQAMTAKEYLMQIRDYNLDIRRLQENLEELKITASGLHAITYDGVKVQKSAKDSMTELIATANAMEDQIYQKKIRLIALRNQIITMINCMADQRLAEVLYFRYVRTSGVRPLPMHQVAECLNYKNLKYVTLLHKKALEAFYNQYKDIIEKDVTTL